MEAMSLSLCFIIHADKDKPCSLTVRGQAVPKDVWREEGSKERRKEKGREREKEEREEQRRKKNHSF